MIPTVKTQNQLERLLSIQWREDGEYERSNTALLREYLRRSAFCAEALQCPDEWPFFNIAAHIMPNSGVSEETRQILNTHLSRFLLTKTIKQTCEWFLDWSAIEQHEEMSHFTFPDPFEPLIAMYERGGKFRTEHGFFYVGFTSFRRGTLSQYLQAPPLASLKPTELGALDARRG